MCSQISIIDIGDFFSQGFWVTKIEIEKEERCLKRERERESDRSGLKRSSKGTTNAFVTFPILIVSLFFVQENREDECFRYLFIIFFFGSELTLNIISFNFCSFFSRFFCFLSFLVSCVCSPCFCFFFSFWVCCLVCLFRSVYTTTYR